MPDFLTLLATTLYFGGPVWVLGWLGYRYGYKQQVHRSGLVWRTLLFCSLLSWSIVGGRAHDTGWALPFPSIACLYLWAVGSLRDTTAIPPVWVSPLFHIAFYLSAVAYGYRTREKTYSPFPGSPP